ncbi:hypothetical protein [Burkholderia multivorans]|uniref:hypothetical protein n=1 Tax=Burkholderia multivorans TaxID=87883 RepID=UPI0020B2525C|nr:hypothetical protein [Burkholderia multivorans]
MKRRAALCGAARFRCGARISDASNGARRVDRLASIVARCLGCPAAIRQAGRFPSSQRYAPSSDAVSVAGLFVPELRALTRADLNALLERVRRDSLHRYNVAFVISWLGGMAGALLLGLLLVRASRSSRAAACPPRGRRRSWRVSSAR